MDLLKRLTRRSPQQPAEPDRSEPVLSLEERARQQRAHIQAEASAQAKSIAAWLQPRIDEADPLREHKGFWKYPDKSCQVREYVAALKQELEKLLPHHAVSGYQSASSVCLAIRLREHVGRTSSSYSDT